MADLLELGVEIVRAGKTHGSLAELAAPHDLEAEIVGRGEFGERTVRFSGADDLYAEFEKIGHVPLPPYIKIGRASCREGAASWGGPGLFIPTRRRSVAVFVF